MEDQNPNECFPGSRQSVDVDISEVDGVSSTPSGLLSLTGTAEELLLSLVGSGEGGVQRLLNLRLVCRHTKEWVDDLPLLHGQRLFSTCQATVDLSEDGSLERFLVNPPPSHVTSLVLLGAGLDFAPKKESWDRFVKLWSSRLKKLQVDQFLPLNTRLIPLKELAASASVRQLHCEGFGCWDPADVPDFLLQLEELRLDEIHFPLLMDGIGDAETKASLQILTSSERLVISKWTLNKDWDLEFAAEVLRIRKHDVKSQVTFKFQDHSTIEGQIVRNFVTAVAVSRFLSIRVKKCPEYILQEISVSMCKEARLKFFRCVESIKSSAILPLTDLPNLKAIVCDRSDLVGLPVQTFIPQLLTCLELSDLRCSARDLLKSLTFVNVSCPCLETLKMFWICESRQELQNNEEFGVAEENGAFFPYLKSLTFRMGQDQWPLDNFAENSRLVLWELLGMPRLSLTSLVVKFGGINFWNHPNDAFNADLFDAELLGALIEGPLGKTLCKVDIKKRWVAEDGKELLGILIDLAQENKRKFEIL